MSDFRAQPADREHRLSYATMRQQVVGDPLDQAFPGWLRPLREAGYDLYRIPEPEQGRVRLALRARQIVRGPGPRLDEPDPQGWRR